MHGLCLCCGVEFQADPPLRPVIACHCTQCRKTSGHFWAATSVPEDRFHLIHDDGLRWFQSSRLARRAFCKTCSASLFWMKDGEGHVSIAAGALDGQTGLTMGSHWHLEDAGDYYTAQAQANSQQGGCLCGANHFTLPRPMGDVTACHCIKCRKLSGHFAASFDASEASLQWRAKGLTEFRTPNGGQRGFCPTCRSSLYFRAANGDFSVAAGAVDKPTGGQIALHIVTADKGDYYALTDGLPQSTEA